MITDVETLALVRNDNCVLHVWEVSGVAYATLLNISRIEHACTPLPVELLALIQDDHKWIQSAPCRCRDCGVEFAIKDLDPSLFCSRCNFSPAHSMEFVC